MKITQKQVAEHLDLNNGDLSSMLKGKLGLSMKNAEKISKATGWTIGAIYDTDLAEIVQYMKFKLGVKKNESNNS